jgi:hypothetical protein
VVYWDADERQDLLIGKSDGTVWIFRNVGTSAEPDFDGGTPVQVGPSGTKVDIDVGSRATPTLVDWNNDTLGDLVVGTMSGKAHVFLDHGVPGAPDFRPRSSRRREASISSCRREGPARTSSIWTATTGRIS